MKIDMGLLSNILSNLNRKRASSSSSNAKDNDSQSPSSSSNSSQAQDHGPLSNRDKFSFLQDLTASERHSGRTFYQHLFGVYTRLQNEGAPPEVCDAGLFHSIYGTEFYRFQDNRITRDIVRGIIGDYAEELVFIFCKARDRFHFIVNNKIGLPTQHVLDLCYIELANLSDQNEKGIYDEKVRILKETIRRLQNGEEMIIWNVPRT